MIFYLHIKKIFLVALVLFYQTAECSENKAKYNIGLLVVATGKYIQFIQPLIASAEKYFCTNHNVTYFIFTDGELSQDPKIMKIYQKRLGWPYDTLMRFDMYKKQKELLSTQDYLFACDADMLFADYVGDEILGDLVAVQHPGYVGKRGSYENNKKSTAYVGPQEGEHYFAGGIFGGKTECFFLLLECVTKNIEKDVEHNYIAIWHDESHLNRFFIDYKPTIILSPSYCYPEPWNPKYPKKLMALGKNHTEIRKNHNDSNSL